MISFVVSVSILKDLLLLLMFDRMVACSGNLLVCLMPFATDASDLVSAELQRIVFGLCVSFLFF